MHLHDLTIKKFHEGLVNKQFTAFEVTQAYFKLIEKKNPELNAYVSVRKDEALKEAEQADLAIAKGESAGMLAGAPFGIKDNILIEGHRATAASKILENYTAAYDATAITRLKKAGAVFLGKTNLDEFAMGSSTENSAFGPVKNPHDTSRVPGGSSGGSAAAVAAHMALAALGSDTGGSVRQPASFCGVVGLKPTYGAVSRHGLIAMASSLDQIGPLARTVEDAAIVFQAIAGRDPFDATSGAPVSYAKELAEPRLEDVRRLRVGLPEEYFVGGVEPAVVKAVEEAVQTIKSLKVEFKKISLPRTKYALSVYYIIMPAEVSANLARYDGIRYSKISNVKPQASNLHELYVHNKSHGFGAETKRRIILGTFALSSGYYDAYYAKAQKVRALIKQDFMNAFREVDVILAPTTPTLPFKLGEKTQDPLSMYLSDVFTIPANLAGLPAISIPVQPIAGSQRPATSLPVGFQLIGKPWREADILRLGMWYERSGSISS